MRIQIGLKKVVFVPESDLDCEIIEQWANKPLAAKYVIGEDADRLKNTYIEVDFG
jgi:hypothetical protein